MDYCKEVEKDGKTFLSDYRIKNGNIPFSKGKLSDLKEWYMKSDGLGNLLSSIVIDMDEDDYKIVEYRGSYGKAYAVGI